LKYFQKSRILRKSSTVMVAPKNCATAARDAGGGLVVQVAKSRGQLWVGMGPLKNPRGSEGAQRNSARAAEIDVNFRYRHQIGEREKGPARPL
jgi:hypothetical protein